MINEEALVYRRGDLIEFKLHIGGGPRLCRGLVLNTAVRNGRAARQIWVVDMDDPTPQLEAYWTKRKHIIPETEIVCLLPSLLIGRDTLLRDNPVCFPVQKGTEIVEIPAVTLSVSLPVPPALEAAEHAPEGSISSSGLPE